MAIVPRARRARRAPLSIKIMGEEAGHALHECPRSPFHPERNALLIDGVGIYACCLTVSGGMWCDGEQNKADREGCLERHSRGTELPDIRTTDVRGFAACIYRGGGAPSRSGLFAMQGRQRPE